MDVASALDYLHNGYDAPVVHCDVTPSNVLLDEDMVGHVSDFGIAKLLGAEPDGTAHTKTLATMGYMAPEFGLEGLISTKCDVYSYGIMLMETFTRRGPPSDDIFSGDMALRHWIKSSFPSAIMQVVDSNLLKPEDAGVCDISDEASIGLH
ncbi:probable LRR receptor-like serine/threonine-protein kinase At3g47570 [Coffea arabica]|uniref:Probable LRR receptor-like serine/threonine-protein kinase At3g47570 n=1 Tax=Coffea arabica TaxID=13443 RepID=A0ABM4VQU1_COFAR